MSPAKLLVCAVLAAGAAPSPLAAQTWTLSTLYTFTGGADGAFPDFGLVLHAGILYGSAYGGGSADSGVLFKLVPGTGAERVLRSFTGDKSQGADPEAGPIYADGYLYGTTPEGGTKVDGVVYKLDLQTRAMTVLHSFKGYPHDGEAAVASLIDQEGTLYGTTELGGAHGGGTVFKVDAGTGAYSVLYSFQGGTDGSSPWAGLLYLNGALYGTTQFGGTGTCRLSCGTVFKVDAATGAESVLYSFQGGSDGAYPTMGVGLVEHGGMLYGVTSEGGASNSGVLFRVDAVTGKEKLILSSAAPGGLTWVGSALYGTSAGSLLQIDPATGAVTVLYSPAAGTAGASGTLLYQDGVFYGTTQSGGPAGQGTVFKLSPP